MLRHRDVRVFISARFVSLLGTTIAPIALAFAVLDVSDSAVALGVVLAARSIPQVVLLLVGGVIADRLPRHQVIVVANGVCCGTQALAATLLVTGHAQIWQLAAIEAVNGAAAAFTMPAMMGVLPALVSSAELPQANAVAGFVRSTAMIGGAAIAGAIVGFAGPALGLYLDAVAYGVAALLMIRLVMPPVERTKSSMLADLREGWGEFVSRQWLWVVVLAFGLINLLWTALWGTLGPVIADDTFGRAGWGLASAGFGIGLIVGGVLMIRLKPGYPLRVGMIGILLCVPVLFCLTLAPVTVAMVVTAFAAGIGFELFGIGWETALGQHIPLDRISRVASYDMLGSFVAIPAGQLAVGHVVGVTGMDNVILYGAAIYAVLTIATLVVPSVWRLPRV